MSGVHHMDRPVAYAGGVDIEYLGFGSIVIDGVHFDHDVVIEDGAVRKRDKAPSRAHKRGGHTPLSADEQLPWGGTQLVIGTGYSGRLPVLPDIELEAIRKKVELVVLPTAAACALLEDVESPTVNAVLHLTC